MKSLIATFALFLSVSSFAKTVNCSNATGEFDNSILAVQSVKLESGSNSFTFLNAENLTINLLGKDEVFKMTALTTSNGSKLDFELTSDPSVKAVLLVNKTPGEVERKRKFKALLVITGTDVNFSERNTSFFSANSFVFNLSCKL